MLILKLAALNIMRNPRRSVITLLAVAVGLASLLFLWAFMDGSHEQQRENVIRIFTGHIQIHAKNFEEKLSPELILPNRAEIIKKIKALPEVVAVTEHVKCEALVGTSGQTRGAILYGMDPAGQPSVLALNKHIKEGAFLDPQDNRMLLMGTPLAKRLEVNVGDKVVVMTQAIDGTLAGYAFHVKGLISSGSKMVDENHVFVTLQAARELLGIGEDSHELIVRLRNRSDIPAFRAAARQFLDEKQYDISSWDAIVPEVNQFASYSESIIKIMLIAIMAVIGVGVMNTILMSVFERTKEIGIMKAMGAGRADIFKIIWLETIIVCSLGGALGSLLAVFGGEFVEKLIRAVMSRAGYVPAGQIVQFTPQIIIGCFLGAIVLGVLSGIWPAYRASSMRPVEAIRLGD